MTKTALKCSQDSKFSLKKKMTMFGLVKKVGWVRRGGREKCTQIFKQIASHMSEILRLDK